MATLTPLNETAWLLKDSGSIQGLVVEYPDHVLFLSPTEKTKTTMDELKDRYGSLNMAISKVVTKTSTIDGYPVKHDDIQVVSTTPPIYVRRNSSIEFVAGYWGFLQNNKWVQSFCPKLSTLQENELVGPFKTRLEMLNRLSSLNNTINLRNVTNET